MPIIMTVHNKPRERLQTRNDWHLRNKIMSTGKKRESQINKHLKDRLLQVPRFTKSIYNNSPFSHGNNSNNTNNIKNGDNSDNSDNGDNGDNSDNGDNGDNDENSDNGDNSAK